MPGYYGQLTGKTYESFEAMRHYEGLEAQRRNVLTAEESAFDNLPAEKVRELVEKASRSEQLKALRALAGVDMQAFFRAYPEYLDCPENAGAMKFYLEGVGVNTKNCAVNFYQLEQAFLHLKEGGFLKLKPSAVKRQQAEAVNDRLAEIEQARPEFNEWDAYNNLSMEEVRQRASTQLSGEFKETARPLNGAVPDVLDDQQRHLTPGSSVNRRGFAESDRL